MSQITLEAHNLVRHFGRHTIIHDVSLQLTQGEILGLLGHNGAGKTTTLQMLSGCLTPSAGKISICGFDLQQQALAAKQQLGYLPEHPPLYRELSVDAFLKFSAQLRRIPTDQINQALQQAKQRCGLESVGQKTISTLSKGYQQRIGIAQAIIHQPQLIILDEPTVGLDPQQLRDIRQLIRELGKNHSVIFSSHLLGEVESLCDRIEILHQGKLIYSNNRAGLQQQHQHYLQLKLGNPPPIEQLSQIPGVLNVQCLSEGLFQLHYDPANNPSAQLASLASQHQWQLEQLNPQRHSLEDFFVSITQQQKA